MPWENIYCSSLPPPHSRYSRDAVIRERACKTAVVAGGVAGQPVRAVRMPRAERRLEERRGVAAFLAREEPLARAVPLHPVVHLPPVAQALPEQQAGLQS